MTSRALHEDGRRLADDVRTRIPQSAWRVALLHLVPSTPHTKHSALGLGIDARAGSSWLASFPCLSGVLHWVPEWNPSISIKPNLSFVSFLIHSLFSSLPNLIRTRPHWQFANKFGNTQHALTGERRACDALRSDLRRLRKVSPRETERESSLLTTYWSEST